MNNDSKRKSMVIIDYLLGKCTYSGYLDPLEFARELHKLQDLILSSEDKNSITRIPEGMELTTFGLQPKTPLPVPQSDYLTEGSK